MRIEEACALMGRKSIPPARRVVVPLYRSNGTVYNA
jgi:hypothetical protein